MSTYNYRKLNLTCAPQGALTSNAKYIAPLAPIYNTEYTNMLKYPGSTLDEGQQYTPRQIAPPIYHKQKCNSCST